MTVALVAGRHLTAHAGAAALVNDVSVTADAGQVVAIVGPNGAGKSTLLEMLAGDRRPDTGTVRLNGDDIATGSSQELARLRAFVGQHVARDIPFRVREVVGMGRYAQRSDPGNSAQADDNAVAAAMEATDISHLGERVVASLSGGEEQRVHVARALAQQTPIALLDEPTSALDISHQELIMRNLRAVAQHGGAVIVVLHDLNLAALYSDRMIMMSRGEAIISGPPRKVLTEATVSTVYGHTVHVIDHPFRDAPLVLSAAVGTSPASVPEDEEQP